MSKVDDFREEISQGYKFEGPSIIMGGAMLDGEVLTDHFVRVPTSTLNRHGLIAGATGTGKTKSLQIMAEQMSSMGIPSLVMDIKGDLSGLAVESDGHPKIDERHEQIGLPFIPDNSPVEFLSLSKEPGARLRATVTEFGPVLFSKMLDLNETQESIVAVLFKYCDDHHLPLLDLEDFKKTLQYISNEGKEDIEKEYGRISTSSVGTIMRKIVELEQQNAQVFFGERSFDVEDLCRVDENGKGVISIIRLTDIQDRPKLFSTFMLQILAEIYNTFEETGDDEKPRLVMFIDEAHLVFDEASDALLDHIETVIKLIRSKGIGIFFVTQNPDDIPDEVLGQLGMKLQHALRAFTAKDRKAIKLAAENYPLTQYYDVSQKLTELGIGEAFISALNEDGIPTPLVHTMMRAPQSRMDVLSSKEIEDVISRSSLIDKYNEDIDRESAYEILNRKLDQVADEEHKNVMEEQRSRSSRSRRGKQKSVFEQVYESTTTRQIGRTIAREITRGLLGALGVKKRRGRSWF
ncbi:MAG: helicase HerA-like domain-containing protein [Saprospiraceae bacterium]|nr:helicase HerA-like domain-containing protein [Saprospiraceae bacterium]